MFTIKEIVKDNIAEFSFYRQNYLYYKIKLNDDWYEFPIEIEDLGTATLDSPMRAITLMRYIRKAIEGNMFNRIKK